MDTITHIKSNAHIFRSPVAGKYAFNFQKTVGKCGKATQMFLVAYIITYAVI